MGRPLSVPESIGLGALVLGGICVGHAALVQLSVLFAAGGRVRALRNVRRTLALLVDRSLLGTTLRAVVLLFAGDVIGCSLYVVAFGLGNVGGPNYGFWGWFGAPVLSCVVLGAAVHYTTVRAIRVFGFVARERVETP